MGDGRDDRALQPPPRKPDESDAAYQYRLDRYLKDRARRPGESESDYVARMKRRDDDSRRKKALRDSKKKKANRLTPDSQRASQRRNVTDRTGYPARGTDGHGSQFGTPLTDADYDGHDIVRDTDDDEDMSEDMDRDSDRDPDDVPRDTSRNVIRLADNPKLRPNSPEFSDGAGSVPRSSRDMRDNSRDTGRGGLGGFHPGSGRGSNPSRSKKNKDLKDKTRVPHVPQDTNRVPPGQKRDPYAPENDPRPILHMTSGSCPVVTYDTPEARAALRRDEIESARQMVMQLFETPHHIPWPVWDLVKPVFDELAQNDPDYLLSIRGEAWAHVLEVCEKFRELDELKRFKTEHERSEDPERLELLAEQKRLREKANNLPPTMYWPGDREPTLDELDSHPIESYLARGYQLIFITQPPVPIPTPDRWSPMSEGEVAALKVIWEICENRFAGDVEAAIAVYMNVIDSYRYEIPGPRPWVWSPELIGGKGKVFATFVMPVRDRHVWDRRYILLRWETMVGLPFDFTPGGPLIESPPPGFKRAALEGRDPSNMFWHYEQERRAISDLENEVFEKLKRLERR